MVQTKAGAERNSWLAFMRSCGELYRLDCTLAHLRKIRLGEGRETLEWAAVVLETLAMSEQMSDLEPRLTAGAAALREILEGNVGV